MTWADEAGAWLRNQVDVATARVRARLRLRRDAYRAVFRQRGNAELTPMAEIVLRDLARECRWHRSSVVGSVSRVTQQADPLLMAYYDGRRSVLAHIRAQLALNDDVIDRLAQPQKDEQ